MSRLLSAGVRLRNCKESIHCALSDPSRVYPNLNMIKAGEKLKEERLKKGLTLEEVSKETKIKRDFLEAIEKSEYNKLPASTFAQGFVKNYTQFLDISESDVIPLFRREFDEERIYKVLPQGFSNADFPVTRFKKSQFILIPLLFFVLIFYLVFQYKDAIISPSLDVSTPQDNQTVSSTLVLVSGSTNPDNVVYVNGYQVSVDEKGNFKKTLSVFSGENQIDIKVVNRFNKSTEKILHITVMGS